MLRILAFSLFPPRVTSDFCHRVHALYSAFVYGLILVYFKICTTKMFLLIFNSIQRRDCHWFFFLSLFLIRLLKGLLHMNVIMYWRRWCCKLSLHLTLGSKKALLCFQRLSSLSPALERTSSLTACFYTVTLLCIVFGLSFWTGLLNAVFEAGLSFL